MYGNLYMNRMDIL